MDIYRMVIETTEAIEGLEPKEAIRYRDIIKVLAGTCERQLSARLVHLSIKARKSGDYVYANWTDEHGNQTAYIGKWHPPVEIWATIEKMEEPHPRDFRLSVSKQKKLEEESAWVIGTYEGGMGIGGKPISFSYNQQAYNAARLAYIETLEHLSSKMASIAQTTRIAGIVRLNRLNEEGYHIIPL